MSPETRSFIIGKPVSMKFWIVVFALILPTYFALTVVGGAISATIGSDPTAALAYSKTIDALTAWGPTAITALVAMLILLFVVRVAMGLIMSGTRY